MRDKVEEWAEVVRGLQNGRRRLGQLHGNE